MIEQTLHLACDRDELHSTFYAFHLLHDTVYIEVNVESARGLASYHFSDLKVFPNVVAQVWWAFYANHLLNILHCGLQRSRFGPQDLCRQYILICMQSVVHLMFECLLHLRTGNRSKGCKYHGHKTSRQRHSVFVLQAIQSRLDEWKETQADRKSYIAGPSFENTEI